MIAEGVARSAISPIQEAIGGALALSDHQMALLQGPAMALPLALSAVPLGFVVDRFSRARLLWLFTAMLLVGTILTAAATGFASLAVARCIVGLMAHATTVAALSLLADLYPPSHRGRATMVVSVGQLAGIAAAFFAGGLILAQLGPNPDAWRDTVYYLAVPLIAALVILFWLSEPSRQETRDVRSSPLHGLADLWAAKAVAAPLFLGKILVGTAYAGVLAWAAPAFARGFALQPDRIGAMIATALVVSGVLGPVVGGALADLCHRVGGPRRTMSAISTLALLSAPIGLFASMPSATTAAITLTLYATVVAVIGVMEMALTTVLIPTHIRGLFLSLIIAVGAILGLGTAPVVVTAVSSLLGGPMFIGHSLSIVCATTGLMGAAAFWLGRRRCPV